MSHRVQHIIFLALAIPAVLPAATPDAGSIGKRREETARRMAEAGGKAVAAAGEVKKLLEDPDGRISRDMTEIEAQVGRSEYDPALGTLGITLDHLDEAPEEKRPAVKDLFGRIRGELQAAAAAQRGDAALEELAARLEPLDRAIEAAEDLVAPLKDLHASVEKAELASALPRADILALRGYLAKVRSTFDARLAKEFLGKASTDLAALEASMADLRKEFDGDEGVRASAHGKYAEARLAIRYSLARIPEADAAAGKLRDRLSKLDAEERAAYSKGYGEGMAATVRENFQFTADVFEGWESEEGAPLAAADYINLEGTAYGSFNFPRTAAYVDRANLWLAYLGTLEGFSLASDHPKVKDQVEKVTKDRGIALDRLHKAAETLVGDLEKTPIEEDRVRDRFAVLADWDLRVALQEDPRQWPLIARLHGLVDAYDRKGLGEEGGLAKIRDEAAKAAEANWTRMTSRTVVLGGFDPLHSSLFKGLPVRLEKVHDLRASFAPGDHDLVLCLDGNYFAARHHPALKAGLAEALARTKTALTPQDELELVAVVGEEGKLALAGPAGAPAKGEAPGIACRKLTVVGIRSGPVAFLAR